MKSVVRDIALVVRVCVTQYSTRRRFEQNTTRFEIRSRIEILLP